MDTKELIMTYFRWMEKEHYHVCMKIDDCRDNEPGSSRNLYYLGYATALRDGIFRFGEMLDSEIEIIEQKVKADGN